MAIRLVENSTTSLDPLPEINIERPHLLKHLHNMFSSKRTCILVEGIDHSGKTHLLRQFANYFSPNSFYFSIGEDYLSSNSISFLIDMCDQLCKCLKIPKTTNIQFESLNELNLRQWFSRFYSKLRKQANKSGPYFFVIDGLDYIQDKELFKLIPPGDSAGIYVLLSSKPDMSYPIKYESWPIQFFSEDDTKKMFKGLGIPEHDLLKIHETYDGIPGYLEEIRRQYLSNVPLQEMMDDLPKGIEVILEREWLKLNLDEISKDLLSIIAYGPESYTIEELSIMLELTQQEIQTRLNKITFIKLDNYKTVKLTNLHRKYLKDILHVKKAYVTEKVINYYTVLNNAKSLHYLPLLYHEQKNVSALVNLLSTDNIIEHFSRAKEINTLRKGFRLLGEIAADNSDWQHLITASLFESVFTDILASPSLLKHEVDALLALNRITEAVNLALSCPLPEDRLLLLAKICNHSKKYDQVIDNVLLDSLEDTVDQIHMNMEMSDEYINKMLDICTDLLPIKTNLVLSIFEKIAENSNISLSKGRLMDLLIMMLLNRIGPEAQSSDDIKKQIDNSSLVDFVYQSSTIFSHISADELIEKVDEITDTSTKLYFIRSWCMTNVNNIDAKKVIEKSLSIIVGSDDYQPTVLHLRQISRPY